MRTAKLIMVLMFIAIVATAFFVPPVMAANTVNVDVNPSASTPGGIAPDTSDGVNAVYNYTVYDGQSVSDTIPVQLCMTGYDAGWNSIGINFGSPSGNLDGVTLPGNQEFTPVAGLPDCHTLNIQISTGPLSAGVGTYNANIGLSSANPDPATGSNKPQISFDDLKNIHIKVEVLEAAGSNVSCFLTDSTASFLTDCAGALVTGSANGDGRFSIVTNKKGIEVSTNPGQFYFNFVWLNTTGSSQTVDVGFLRAGVLPNGAQAIHSAVFNGYLSTVNPADFDEANANGIPDGTDDEASAIVVPAGYSLLVTYHLTWADRGSPLPGDAALDCATANQLIQVTGSISGAGIRSESCTSGASGYKK